MDIFSSNNLAPVSFRRYLNKVEVCLFLRISLPTLNRWIRNGDFPHPINLVSALWAGHQK